MNRLVCSFTVFLLSYMSGNCQLTGIKNIPGDYPTVIAAVADLNLMGVGIGGVTFRVATGFVEISSAPITITATGTAGNPILFTRWGAGINPLIKRTDAGTLVTSTEGGAGDAVIRIEGTDYITFDGLDVKATNQGIEYGYLTHKPSGTDGCQYVTIKHSTITMTKGTSAFVTGIYISNGTTSVSSATGVSVTSASGINSHIIISGDTVQNVHYGIKLLGCQNTGFYDSVYIIGRTGEENLIRNFGGNVINVATYAISMQYFINASVCHNTVVNAGGGWISNKYSFNGIWFKIGGGVFRCDSNFIKVSEKFENFVSPITVFILFGAPSDSVYCRGNVFASDTLSGRGGVFLISANADSKAVISGNSNTGTIDKTSVDDELTCIRANAGTPQDFEIHDNHFSDLHVTGYTKFYGIYSEYFGASIDPHHVNVYNNTISNVTGTGSSGEKIGICLKNVPRLKIYGNTVHTISGLTDVIGIQVSAPQNDTGYIFRNRIYDLLSITWDDWVIGIYITTGQAYYVYNNYISDLRATVAKSTLSGFSVVGLHIGGGFYTKAWYNTIFLNASSTTTSTFTTACIRRSTSSPSITELRNNIAVNLSTPAAGGGMEIAISYQGGYNPASFDPLSNYNCYFAGTPGTGHYIAWDGTTGYTDIASYKAAIAPMECQSISENPSFINSVSTPYDLHINPVFATGIESGGSRVTSPFPVTNDYDSDWRWGETGYTGGGTAPDIGADEFEGISVPCATPVPGTTITTDASVCEGTPVTLSLQTCMPAGGYSFQWRISTDNITFSDIPGATGSFYTFTPITTAYYECLVSCGLNSATSVSVQVSVIPAYPVTVTISTPRTSLCQGTMADFTATATNPGANPVYLWTVNGVASGSNQPLFSYFPANNDVVGCRLVSSLSCHLPDTASGNTIQMTVASQLPVSVTISSSADTVCQGAGITLTAIPVNPGVAPGYQWKVNGNNTGSNQPVLTYIPLPGDVVTVTLTVAETCATGNPAVSAPYPVIVTPSDPAGVSVSASANPVCNGVTVTFNATGSNGGSNPSFQWKVNGVNAGTNSSAYSYIPLNNDTITCTMISTFTCVTNNPATSPQYHETVIPVPLVTFTLCFDTITTLNAKPFKLKGGIPLNGTYSGTGVAGGIFNPSTSGIGIKTITYTYTIAALCSASKTKTITVLSNPSFTCGKNLTDIRDGKSYPTVQLGSQCWMAANLNYGTMISGSSHQRDNCINEKYCLNDLAANCGNETYYQWDELMRYDDTPGLQGICLPGWHVPTETEWNTLFANWTNSGFAGAPLKFSGYSGFNATLSGARHQNVQWDFMNFATLFWSSTPRGSSKAWAHGMNDYDPSVSAYPSIRSNAFSVRCLHD
jgi:uncharacterized protein (TIGR02145 family)